MEGVVSDRVGNSRPNGILANAIAFAVCITADFWTVLEALKRNRLYSSRKVMAGSIFATFSMGKTMPNIVTMTRVSITITSVMAS